MSAERLGFIRYLSSLVQACYVGSMKVQLDSKSAHELRRCNLWACCQPRHTGIRKNMQKQYRQKQQLRAKRTAVEWRKQEYKKLWINLLLFRLLPKKHPLERPVLGTNKDPKSIGKQFSHILTKFQSFLRLGSGPRRMTDRFQLLRGNFSLWKGSRIAGLVRKNSEVTKHSPIQSHRNR